MQCYCMASNNIDQLNMVKVGCEAPEPEPWEFLSDMVDENRKLFVACAGPLC
eukprot:m.311812 g.311812  ORF g.311812 m.311812 type:complete len:52 (+) comp154185_c0_seq1:788-943(+)